MTYIEKKEKEINYYEVTFDKEKLKDIFNKLKSYKYIEIGKGRMAGEITNWPATKKNIKKRVISLFDFSHKEANEKIFPETIIHHVDKDNDYVTYEYSYDKYPDLYYYIDIILNNKSVLDYNWIFNSEKDGLPLLGTINNKEQIIIEKILNYIDSYELTNHNIDGRITNEKYDYIGLNKLYKETLECLKFKLIAVKSIVEKEEIITGLVLQKKKKL